MIYGIFTVFDKKLLAYMQPFFSVNTGTALRSFGDACTDKASMLYQHPEDFQLYKIADYDDQTAAIEPHNPVAIADAQQRDIEQTPTQLKEMA